MAAGDFSCSIERGGAFGFFFPFFPLPFFPLPFFDFALFVFRGSLTGELLLFSRSSRAALALFAPDLSGGLCIVA